MGCLVGDPEALRSAFPHVDLFLQPSDYVSLVHHLCDHDLVPTGGAGALVATGMFMADAVFGVGDPRETTLTSAGQRDIFLASFNADGRF